MPEQELENILEKHDYQLYQFIKTYRIDSWRENIYIIFGTKSILKALVFPGNRQLPLRGLEWSLINQNSEDQSVT